MIPVKINGDSYEFPTFFTEVTLGQFFKLRKANGLIDEICALTGLDKTQFSNFRSKEDLFAIQSVLQVLSNDILSGVKNNDIPSRIVMGDRVVMIPKNLELQPIGAYITAYNAIADEHKRCEGAKIKFDPTDVIPQILAAYLWLPYHGDSVLYDDSLVESESYMDIIYSLKMDEVRPIANFFFLKYPDL